MHSFYANDNLRIRAVTTEQMREVDRIAVQETGPNLYQMMENAGRSLALMAMEMMQEKWRHATFVVLAGSGGNGGGGVCAARHLANRGLDVRVCLANPDHLFEVTAWQRHVFLAAGGQEMTIKELTTVNADIILDAVIGYSLKAAPHSAALNLIRWANQTKALKLSLDVPSGIDATTGEHPGEYVQADRTLTLALPKTGLLPALTGELYLADIGIPSAVYAKIVVPYSSPFGKEFCVPLRSMTE